MIAIYFNLIGILLYYSKVKYFPKDILTFPFSYEKAIGLFFFIVSLGVFIYQWGGTIGCLMYLTSLILSASVVQLFAVLGKKWFYSFLILIHVIILINLFKHAS
ncbi:hypothetical protein J2Y60_002073 [Arcicella sp. BE140]|nr:hypothetical protein [Arcicella sp. BE140]MDR6822904.1 hypothetical protein [Arcicella sp. BE139]